MASGSPKRSQGEFPARPLLPLPLAPIARCHVRNRRANKDHFERIGALAAYAEYGKGQKAMVVLPLSAASSGRVWVPDEQLKEIEGANSVIGKLNRKGTRMCTSMLKVPSWSYSSLA